ncbi:MAG: hypothetical protein V4497_01015 [Bacteroidota bacterium]
MKEKVNIKVVLFLLLLLASTTFYSFTNIPEIFETEGGSCYQGITATIIRFLIKVCFTLSTLSIVLAIKNWKTTSKFLSILSVIFWLIWSLAISSEHSMIGIKYFSSFMLTVLIVMIFVMKNRTTYKISETEN